MTEIRAEGAPLPTWNAEGQVSKAPTAYVIKDGEYVLPEA